MTTPLGYELIRTLRADETYLAAARDGRRVVLKALPKDCLLGGQLHPNVKDRLARVRELAMTSVAHLYAVERSAESGEAFLVWEYLEGVPFDVYASDAARTLRELAAAMRGLILAVDTL